MTGIYSKRFRQPRADLTNQRFGKLTVLKWAGDSRWACVCDCGKTALILTANLRRGNSGSCGCVRNIKSSKRATTHGLSKTLAYKTWLSVRARCRNEKHPSYKDYGARGIDIHQPWYECVVRFVADVGQPPTPDHSLDRIDNSNGYFPGNVRWATDIEQANNKTNNVWVTYRDARYTIAQLARAVAAECEIEPSRIRSALEKELAHVKRNPSEPASTVKRKRTPAK